MAWCSATQHGSTGCGAWPSPSSTSSPGSPRCSSAPATRSGGSTPTTFRPTRRTSSRSARCTRRSPAGRSVWPGCGPSSSSPPPPGRMSAGWKRSPACRCSACRWAPSGGKRSSSPIPFPSEGAMRQPIDVPPRPETRGELSRLFELQAAKRWELAGSDAGARRERLRRLKAALERHRAAIAEGIRRDFGRPAEESEFLEIHPTLQEVNDAIAHLGEWMRPEQVGTPLLLADTSSEIRWEPKGQVLILAPWNYPLFLVIGPLVGAVAAGNTVILKPSEKVPETNRALRQVVADAFPENEVAMVEGDASVAEALLALPFNHLFFTGSTRIGKVVMTAAARTLASVTLELGGKSPAYVAPGANLARAAQAIAWGKFVNAGQTCVAPDYVLVQESQRDELLRGLRASTVASYGPEEGWEKNSDFARLIDPGAFGRVKGPLDEAVQRGAKVAFGGSSDPAQRFIAPTALVDVPADAAILQEEIFGPVLPIVTYRTPGEALQYVRSRPQPLALYAFGNGRETRDALAGTTSGGACLNNVLLQFANPHLPVGGVGPSGLGNYHGRAGFRTFSHERSVLRQSGNPMSRWLAPPYAGRMNRLVSRLARFLE